MTLWRVCIIGAESTGKTTLIRALNSRLGHAWVPEYGRMYTVGKHAAGTNDAWVPADFAHIAAAQQALEDALATTAPGPVLWCDTDALATVLWEERYLGSSSEQTRTIAAARHYDLYVLCDPAGVAYEHDGIRERADLRQRMHQRFVTELRIRCQVTGEPWIQVSGDEDERVAAVMTSIAAQGMLR